jgi:hypothetical protein
MAHNNNEPAGFTAGTTWIKLSVIYLVIGVAMGIVMGATHDVTLKPVHAHVNLLGWTSLALAGLIYTVFPLAGQSRLAKVHFWLMNLALPVMMVALAAVLNEHMEALPALIGGEMAAAVAVLSFAANVLINLHPPVKE